MGRAGGETRTPQRAGGERPGCWDGNPLRRGLGPALSLEGSTAAWQGCWSPAAVPPPWQVSGRGPATRHPSAQTTRRAPLLTAPGAPGARGKGTGVCSPSVHLSVYPCVPLSNTSINLSNHPSLVHICFSIQPSVQPPELSICPSLPPPRGAACPGGLCLQTPRDLPPTSPALSPSTQMPAAAAMPTHRGLAGACCRRWHRWLWETRMPSHNTSTAPSWCQEPSWRAGCVHGTVTGTATVHGTCRAVRPGPAAPRARCPHAHGSQEHPCPTPEQKLVVEAESGT